MTLEDRISATLTPPAAPAPLTEPRTRVRTIMMLGALTALPALSIDAYLPALPSLARDLATTPAATQLTLTAVLLGLSLGQFFAGPLSDRTGRRRPLITGLTVFVVSSLLCAVAPSVELLVVLRLVQGLSGGAVVVVTRAVVRDQVEGAEAARVFARLMLVMGVAPIVAPIAGAQLLRLTSWRGVFVALALIGVGLLLMTSRRFTESLPVERRSDHGAAETLRLLLTLLRDRVFMGYVLAGALSAAAMFAYISASPFVLQEIHGISPAVFSAIFASNAAGLIGLSQLSAHLVGRTGPRPLFVAGLCTGAVGAVSLLVVVLTDAPLPLLLAAFFLIVSSVGLVGPNSTALALADHGAHAGSASAMIGVLQFTLGGLAAPLTGIAGDHTAVPLAFVVLALSAAAVSTTLMSRRRLHHAASR